VRYCHVQIDPEAVALKYDETKVHLDTLAQYGFTVDEAKAAQKLIVPLYASEILDSSRLDDYTVSDADWFAANSRFYSPTAQPEFAKYVDKGALNKYGLIATELLPSPLVRDGSPRASTIQIELTDIYVQQPEGGVPNLIVRFESTSTYDVTDEQMVKVLRLHDNSLTKEGLKQSDPEYFDGEDSSSLVINATSVMSVVKGTVGGIDGNSSTFSLATDEGRTVVE
jgi:hypothetical protein